MSAAVERVAAALAWCDGIRDYSGLVDDEQDTYRTRARAAFGAIREPDEAMVEAGDMAPGAGHAYRSGPIWRAMVDAALSAPQSGCEVGYSDAGQEKPAGGPA